MDAQVRREKEMADRGYRRAQSNLKKTLDRGEAAETAAGLKLVKRAVEPLSMAIRAFVAEAYSGKGGRRHTAAILLKDVDPDLAAYVTVRSAISSAARRNSLRSCAHGIAQMIEWEKLADRFELTNEPLLRSVLRNAAARGIAPARAAKSVELAAKNFNVPGSRLPSVNDQQVRLHRVASTYSKS